MNVGTRVRLNKSLIGLPRDTVGIVDFVSQYLTWVAWDTPANPLPAGYDRWNHKAYLLFRFRREAFEADEVTELLSEIATPGTTHTPPDAAPEPESKGPTGPE